MTVLCLAVATVVCDLLPGPNRNTYLPPEPTKGYDYNKPPVPFSRPTVPSPRPTYPVGPTRPTPSFPTGPTRPSTPGRPTYPGPGPRPTPGFPTPGPRPTPGGGGYPAPGPRPTPGFPDYTGSPSGGNRNTVGQDVSALLYHIILFLLAGHKVDFIALCGENKSTF